MSPIPNPTAGSIRLTVRQIAERMALSETLVYRMLRERRLPGERFGKRWIVTQAAFDRWAAGCGMEREQVQ